MFWFVASALLLSFIAGLVCGFLFGPILGVDEWTLTLVFTGIFFVLFFVFSS